jgi:hypothetical protein
MLSLILMDTYNKKLKNSVEKTVIVKAGEFGSTFLEFFTNTCTHLKHTQVARCKIWFYSCGVLRSPLYLEN